MHRLFLIFCIVLLLLSSCNNNYTPSNPIGGQPPMFPRPVYPQIDQFPVWSPDGNTILYYHLGITTIDPSGSFHGNPDSTGLWMVNADGTNPHLVLRGSDIYANWSMNGQWIVFDQGAQIYKAPVIGDSIDNTHIVRLTSMGRNFLPAFSPDGKWIAFDSNLNDSLGANVIWKIKADGSEIHDISKHGIGEWRMPNWSPDGGKIVHQRYIDVDAPEIVVMDTWGDNSTRLTNDKRFESFPRYSRDGLKIAFQSQLEGLPHVWVMNADGSNQCQLTTDGGETPAWSPDGRLVYVHYNPLKRHPGNGTLWIMNSDGSNKHQITFGPY